ncbi:MAG TPA: DciA family protein [Rhizomicrobium sp.]|jgi:hypothetical protein|nr:DciA family protein [Rhizomicrobium sp.]
MPLGSESGLAARAAFVRAGFVDPTLVLQWEHIAGPETARLARPLKLRPGPQGGVLTLRAEPGAALFLQHESRALCERINAYLGRPAVARLRFVQGPLSIRPAPPLRKTGPAAIPAEDPVRKYQGPERLRDAILKLALRRRANP